MLRVGLTGGLASGKTTIAHLFAEMGARVIAADEVGRRLMQPGQPVYDAIVSRFGKHLVSSDGSLDRAALAELAFLHNQGDALNRIVHPAVIAAEEEWTRNVFEQDPAAVVIVESALIFEAASKGTAPNWLARFDKLILVTVPDEVKIARFVARGVARHAVAAEEEEQLRTVLERDARARLAAQIPDCEKAARCDYVIVNTEPIEQIRVVAGRIYRELQAVSARSHLGVG
jgi:dephospho-CoA kinase